MVEYLDPVIAGDGQDCSNWNPGDWILAPEDCDPDTSNQPQLPEPHIWDYKSLKEHPRYRRYFAPHRYRPFPCWLYNHETKQKILVEAWKQVQTQVQIAGKVQMVLDRVVDVEACQRKVFELGPAWKTKPFAVERDMTGKTLPVESDTQRLTRVMSEMFARGGGAPQAPANGGVVDPTMIGAIVAATLASLNGGRGQREAAKAPDMDLPEWANPASAAETPASPVDQLDLGSQLKPAAEDEVERAALLELAQKEGVKVDGRWSTATLKEKLGL